MLINDLYTNKTPAVAEAIGDLGSSRDRGKSVRKWRKQRGLDEQGPTDVSRRGFLRGLAAFAASAAVPAPVVKLLSTPAGVATLPVAAGVALLKGIQDHLDQFDPEDDDDYHEAWENMADELGFENNDDGDSAHAQLADLVNLNRQNPELAAAQLIKHIQSGAGVNPEDVKAAFVSRADDPSDWRYQRKQQDAKGVEIAQQLRAASLRWRNKDDDDDDDYYDAGSNQIISTLLGHAADKFELDINDGIKLWRQLAAHSGREGFDDAQEEIYLTLQDHGINPEHAYKATSGAADEVSNLAKVARLAGVAKGVGSSNNQAAASTVKHMGPVQYAKDTLALPAPAKPEFDLAPDLKQKEKVPSKQSLREKITVVRDPAQATGIQHTGGITRGSVYSSGKPLPQSIQQKLDGNPNTGRAVDAKGRTQQQWMQLVKVNFPNAKIMQSKMIDGLCQAILPDGRRLSWIKVDKQSTEIDEASWNPIDGADYPVDLTGREMVTGPSDQKWQAMVNYYHDDILVRRALDDLDSKNSRTGNIQYVATIDPGHGAGHAGKHQTKYFKSKEEAYRYAKTMNVRITSIEKLDHDQVDPPVTYNVILGIGEHRRMFKLTFASNALAQKWAHDNRNVVKIQWNDQRSEYSPPTTPRVDPEKADVAEGTEGQVVFSGTGADGGTYEVIQSSPTDFMIHANGKHIDTYGSLQRAMSVLQNEVPGLQQGMAEGLPQTLRKVVPGYAKREIDKKMDAEKFGRTDVDRDANYYRYKKIQDKIKEQGVAEAQTDYQKRRQRERDVDAGRPVKPPPRNPQNDYFARRKKEKEQGVDESWKSALGGAALAGSMAMGGGAAQAQNAPSGEDFLPAIVAHVAFKVNGNTVTKDINLGTSFKSPGQASAALEKLLKEKGIKFYNFTLERVSDTEYNNNYLDKTPLTDKGNPAAYHTADKGYTPSDNTAGDYMVKEGPVTKKPQPYNDPNWIKKLPKDQLDALGGKRYNKDKKPVSEVSLGDYRKKAAVSQAVAQTNKFFDRDDAAKVARADKTIANREKGLARADARVKPYAPPVHDAEKYQRDLTAKYPNIDDLVADAERNRDPYYNRAEGSAYYAGREAEQLYQRLKQIQRVIQGLNESRQKLDEFDPINDPISKKKVDTTSPPQAAGGMKFDLMGRPYKPAPVTVQPEPTAEPVTKPVAEPIARPIAKPIGTAMPLNPYQVPTARTTATPDPAAVPSTAMTTTDAPGFNAGSRARSSAAPELQTIDAPAQLTGPAQAKQLGMANSDITDVVARAPTAKRVPAPNLAALPAPAAPTTPNYGKSVADYSNTTMNAPTALVPNTKSMQPANMMPRTATAPSKPAVSTTAAKNDIVQALKKLGYKSKEAKAAIRGLPPNISTSDAIRQILRGKPTTTESLTWSKNFDPGRSLHRKMKQDR